ncbi:MAG TPA: hypothetical protein VIK92_05195 [Thermaerobacter sp.]
MNRREFWHEMARSLIDTIKAAAGPLVEGYAEGIQETVDRLEGVTWVPVPAAPVPSPGAAELVFVARKAFYLYRNGKLGLGAIENRCDRCGGLLVSLTEASKVKCFSCDRDFDLLKEEGSLKPRPVPLKEEDGRLYLGVKDHES